MRVERNKIFGESLQIKSQEKILKKEKICG